MLADEKNLDMMPGEDYIFPLSFVYVSLLLGPQVNCLDCETFTHKPRCVHDFRREWNSEFMEIVSWMSQYTILFMRISSTMNVSELT